MVGDCGSTLAGAIDQNSNGPAATGLPLVQLLREIVQSVKWLFERRTIFDRFQPPASFLRATSQRGGQSTLPVAQCGVDCFHCWHDPFRRFAGRERAHIGDQIGQRDVDFMAHRRDHWNARSVNCTDDHFFVERPKIFQAAATAADHQNVDGCC